MQDVTRFFELLSGQGIDFYTGVPDSLLKSFCAYVTSTVPEDRHLIAANEGNSIGLACGYYLGTGKPALVYMQNSGVGNAINPLMSLADPEVYSVPMLLMIGWRGKPGVKDEPQHVKQGRVMEQLLTALEIEFYHLDDSGADSEKVLLDAVQSMKRKSAPVVLLVSKDYFSKFELPEENHYENSLMSREQAIDVLLEYVGENDLIVSTTGMASRELFELRKLKGQSHCHDFLTVGGMGHASSIAQGLSLVQQKRVVCIDGDGAVLMHMGALGVLGVKGKANLLHIVLNNGAHDSVGGQPTVGRDIALSEIAKSCAYCASYTTSEQDGFRDILQECGAQAFEGPVFIEVKVKKGSRVDLGRPTSSPLENKYELMRNLGVLDV